MFRRRGPLTLRREDGRIVCEEVTVADTFVSRTVGLLGRRSLSPGKGITLRPSFSIHTFFMRFPIDVVFLGQDLVVLKIAASLPAFRTASCRGAREIVELSAGECERRGLGIGDRVAWASHAVPRASNGNGVLRAAELRATVLVASHDARFVKLARFLLDQHGLDVATTTPEGLASTLESEERPAVVVLDVHDSVGETLALANAAQALHPDVPLVLVGEPRAVERSPAGVRLYDKWNETDELISEVAELVPAGFAGFPGERADDEVVDP